MTDNSQQQPLYWFDTDSGKIIFSQDQLPRKKSSLYLVVNREKLFFNSFSLHSKKKIKDHNILSIQGHFIPFKNDYTNIIYAIEKGSDKQFLSWIGSIPIDVESYFYDEIPESLLFKGDPSGIKNYNIFVFHRLSGFEILYFDGNSFYTLFEKEAGDIMGAVVWIARKFSVKDRLAIFSDVQIPELDRMPPHYQVTVDYADTSDSWYFMPDYLPIKKRYSNISRSKQQKSIKTIIHSWSRNLTIIALLLLLVVMVNGAGLYFLQKENANFKKQYDAIDKMDRQAEVIRFRLNKIKNKILEYPDHMLYLKTLADAMDIDSTIISYSLNEGMVVIEGYSTDSLGLLSRLRKSQQFEEVRFKTTVTKNVYSQREKFEIEMILKNSIQKKKE